MTNPTTSSPMTSIRAVRIRSIRVVRVRSIRVVRIKSIPRLETKDARGRGHRSRLVYYSLLWDVIMIRQVATSVKPLNNSSLSAIQNCQNLPYFSNISYFLFERFFFGFGLFGGVGACGTASPVGFLITAAIASTNGYPAATFFLTDRKK